jgi:hypothetical protein
VRQLFCILVVGATLTSVTTAPASARRANSICLTNQETAYVLVANLKQRILLIGDSTALARYGLVPVDTANVTLETDDSTCAAAVSAFNQAHATIQGWMAMQDAYVVRAGPSRYVVHDQRRASHWSDIIVFDAAWVRRAWLVG